MGSVADLNATLASLTYTGNLDVFGLAADTITITADDLANSGIGGAQTDVETIQLDIVNVNDAPVLGNNSLTLSEGQTVVLGAGDLSATDVDNLDPALQFIVSGVTGGQFELVASPGAAITTFTQAQLTSGAIQFVHDGNEAAPTYSVSVDDGMLATPPAAATVTFTNVNDAPVLGNNSLTVSEGQTVVLGAGDLSATDIDNVDASLQFTVSSVTGGQFELVTSPGAAITTFTQAQVTSGAVQFVHDGNEAAPTYDVSVFDGALATPPAAAAITFTNVNDAPVIGNNSLTISEGQTVVLGAGDLSATDVDNLDSTLQFTVSGVTGGQFELVAAPGAAITTFTQAQVTSGAVQFVHDGNEAAPTYSVSVFDGALTTGPAAATIAFTNVNDAPSLDLDADDSSGAGGSDFTTGWTEGLGPVAVVDSDGSLTDPDSPTLQSVTVTITNLLDSALEVLTADTTGTSIVANYTSATGTLVLSGADTPAAYEQVLRTVAYDNASLNPDATTRVLSFVADDGIVLSPIATTSLGITPVNNPPVAAPEAYSPTEDTLFTTTAATGVLANDSDPDSAIQAVLVSGPSNAASFTLNADGSFSYMPAANFFGTDTFSYVASDGALDSAVTVVTLTTLPVNDAPQVAANLGMRLLVGGTAGIGSSELRATDVDDAASSLVYTVTSAPTSGQLVLTSNPGVAATSFTQADINAGRLTFEQNSAGSTGDSFSFTVADPSGATVGPVTFQIDIDHVGEPVEPETEPEVEPPVAPPVLPPSTTDPELVPETEVADTEPSVELPPRFVVTTQSTLSTRAIVDVLESEFDIPEFPQQEEIGDSYLPAEERSRIANILRGIDVPIDQILDEIRADIQADADAHLQSLHTWVLRGESLILALSTGLVAVLLRSSALWAVALSALPMWRRLDPVAVLGMSSDHRRRRDEEVRFAELMEDETTRVGKLLDEEDDDTDGSS